MIGTQNRAEVAVRNHMRIDFFQGILLGDEKKPCAIGTSGSGHENVKK